MILQRAASTQLCIPLQRALALLTSESLRGITNNASRFLYTGSCTKPVMRFTSKDCLLIESAYLAVRPFPWEFTSPSHDSGKTMLGVPCSSGIYGTRLHADIYLTSPDIPRAISYRACNVSRARLSASKRTK